MRFQWHEISHSSEKILLSIPGGCKVFDQDGKELKISDQFTTARPVSMSNVGQKRRPGFIKLRDSKQINTPVRIRIHLGHNGYEWQVWAKDNITGSKQFEWMIFAYVWVIQPGPQRVWGSCLEYLGMKGISN